MRGMNHSQTDVLPQPTGRLIVQAIGFDLSPSIHQHVSEQADRLFRHEPTIERIEFFCQLNELKSGSREYAITARIAVPGPDIKVEVQDEKLFEGITELSHKLDRQLRRRSRKLNNHRNRRVDLHTVDSLVD